MVKHKNIQTKLQNGQTHEETNKRTKWSNTKINKQKHEMVRHKNKQTKAQHGLRQK